MSIISKAAWLAPVILIGAAVGVPFCNVSNGHTGIDTFFGEVVGTRASGYSFKAPWIEVVEMDNLARSLPNEKVEVPTHDLQQIHLDVTTQYSILGAGADQLYQAFGDEKGIETAILEPGVLEVTKSVSARHDAYELQQKSDAIKDEATQEMRKWVADSLALRGIKATIDVNNVLFSNVTFSDKFKAATSDLTTTEQSIPSEEKKRDTLVTNANATKAAKIRSAQAEATSIKLNADAESAGIISKSQALKENPGLLCYLASTSWDGNPSKVVTGGGNALQPFSDLCKK